ncbi:hypothetical protein ETA_09630 [Erwinia tasmaniensis Et1/99]|uniref:Uncharacterized protein n=1 Tax=Erwinia tasmaniensis (strain DSM 17950 / CFBP 7177 / CIP 109463 / NCPPB 4357 / Et1/99) TaxID=465817 RepID=B2VED4_ERWT9|nr:hypothetical protein ETA_09630 [Erwinia tasmaniensis Et1/99]
MLKSPGNISWKNIKFESSGNIFKLDDLVVDIKTDLLAFHNKVMDKYIPGKDLNPQEKTIPSSSVKIK